MELDEILTNKDLIKSNPSIYAHEKLAVSGYFHPVTEFDLNEDELLISGNPYALNNEILKLSDLIDLCNKNEITGIFSDDPAYDEKVCSIFIYDPGKNILKLSIDDSLDYSNCKFNEQYTVFLQVSKLLFKCIKKFYKSYSINLSDEKVRLLSCYYSRIEKDDFIHFSTKFNLTKDDAELLWNKLEDGDIL